MVFGNLLSYFCLENPTGQRPVGPTAHRVTTEHTSVNEEGAAVVLICTELVFQCRRHKRCGVSSLIDVSFIPELGRSLEEGTATHTPVAAPENHK